MVEKYKFVGSGVTNSQGVAQLTHDANGNPLATPGYVGSGKGLTQMCASLDSPTAISSGSDLSEIYEVIDATFKDIATSSDYNQSSSAWLFRNCTDSIRTREPDGTLLDVTDASLTANAQIVPNTNNFYANYIPKNTCVEVDIVEVDTSDRIEFTALTRRASSLAYPQIALNNYTAPFHVKMELGETTVKLYVDNNLIVSQEYDDINNYRVYFQFLTGRGQYLKFKNFVYYPI